MLHNRHLRPRRPQRPRALTNRITTAGRDAIICDYLESLDSPRALAVWLLYTHKDYGELVKLTIDPHSYNDARSFRAAYAATKFFSKCADLPTGINTEDVAIASAIDAETLCRETNSRFKANRRTPGVISGEDNTILYRASQILAAILGPVPTTLLGVGWSPGRTSSAYGEELASLYKYASRPDVTLSCRKYALRELRSSPSWGAAVLTADAPCSILSKGLDIVLGNTMITVPKNAKTDRVICYEPHMNIWCQRSVGAYIRHRLSLRGVDLGDQSVNQKRARYGALNGSYATIDLSMASDTLACEVIFELLPIDWALLLDDLRSKYTLWPDGTQRRNEKFSSMGNGFTFELESLIFYALGCAVSKNVSVFGDDIIVPVESFEDVRHALELCGFRLNQTKSFNSSYFRESCGADYFANLNCTPVYLRSLPKTTGDVVKLHNAIRSYYERGYHYPPIRVERFLAEWRRVHTCHVGPSSGSADGHYHVDFEVARPKRAGNGVDGWWYKTFTRVSRVNRLYGDRVEGAIPSRYSYAAFCAATGPKRSRSLYDSSVDRRQYLYKETRALASFCWPTISWDLWS